MAKVKLELNAVLDLLNRDELAAELAKAGQWQRETAQGLRHLDLPRLKGTPSGGNLTLDGGQTEGQAYCGPQQGFYWKVERVSVDGLAAGDQVKLWKGGPNTRFVAWIAFQPGVWQPSGPALVLKADDFLSITGSGLAATGQITVTGECVSVPGPLMWKLL